MSSSPWIERLTSLPLVAAIAVPAYALALFTWVDTGWAPLASSGGVELALGVATGIAFGYAIGRWWATAAGLLLIPALVLTGLEWATSSGVPRELGPFEAFALFIGGPAVLAVPIALGIGLRRAGGKLATESMVTVVGLVAVAAVIAASLYVQTRTRLPFDHVPDDPEITNVAAGSFRGIAIGDKSSTLPRESGQPVVSKRTRASAPPLDASGEGISEPFSSGPFYRYDDVTFYSDRGTRRRVGGFLTIAPDAETDRGVGIGDGLKLARDRYDEVECGRDHDSDHTSTVGPPYCKGRLGENRFVFFAGNPIESMSLTRWAPR